MPSVKRITHAAVRRLALRLPEAEESSHGGHPDVRVRNRIFIGLPNDPVKATLKTTPANLDALIAADPETYSDAWGQRWVGVRLDRVSLPTFRALLLDAWKLAAPRKLIAAQAADVPTRQRHSRKHPRPTTKE